MKFWIFFLLCPTTALYQMIYRQAPVPGFTSSPDNPSSPLPATAEEKQNQQTQNHSINKKEFVLHIITARDQWKYQIFFFFISTVETENSSSPGWVWPEQVLMPVTSCRNTSKRKLRSYSIKLTITSVHCRLRIGCRPAPAGNRSLCHIVNLSLLHKKNKSTQQNQYL